MISDFFSISLAIIVFILWLLIMRKVISNRVAPVRTANAEVIDKYRRTTSTKFTRIFAPDNFIVVFKTSDKKLSFAVSEFSYKSYIIKDKGTLKYRGNQIISFE